MAGGGGGWAGCSAGDFVPSVAMLLHEPRQLASKLWPLSQVAGKVVRYSTAMVVVALVGVFDIASAQIGYGLGVAAENEKKHSLRQRKWSSEWSPLRPALRSHFLGSNTLRATTK